MAQTIIAIDPGPHVGFAMRKDGKAHVFMIHNDIQYIWNFIIEAKPDVLIVERFATGGRISADGLETVEIVGSIKALAHVLGAKLVVHIPQRRYPMLQVAKKRLPRGRTQHEIDAYAHLLMYEQSIGAT